MENCNVVPESEGAVNFLQFNCNIWQQPVDSDAPWWEQFYQFVTRSINSRGQIEGFETPGGIISAAWPFIFGIAGIILFAMLLWGSMEIMFGAATPKSAESGKTRITYAIIGFVILFMVFWIGQIIQQIFGINFGIGPMPTPSTP